MAVSVLNTDANLSGNTLALLEVAGTVTALWTFDRDPSAPFAVSASSAVVSNLDADKLDGVEGTSFLRSDAADIKDTGDLTLNDSIALTLGTGGDVDIEFDGTDMLVTKVVGAGDVVVSGMSLEFDDAEGVTLGTGKDATIKYDGTDLVIAPAAVGAGDVHVSGGSVEVDDSESFTLGTGKDATIIYDGTDLTISPAAVGSGDLVIAGASAEFADDEGVTLGTGKDATLQYDGTNVSLDTQAVGSGLLIVTGSAAISGVEIDNTATDGDPTLAFTLSGTSLFTMGVDDGDSDKFKIGTTAIGTNTALTIDGSQNVGIGTDAPAAGLSVEGGAIFNDSHADVDFRVETDTLANMLSIESGSFGGVGTLGIGVTDAFTNLNSWIAIKGPATTCPANEGFKRVRIATNGGAVTIPSGTSSLVATLQIDEPNITATGTVTEAATLFVSGAPTEGTSNYALVVDAGVSRFDGSIDLVGGQIAFPATQVASANANTLDDYEEGSWTPVLGGADGTSGQGYTDIRDGRYVKIGKVVTITFHLKLTTEGTISGDCQIQDLPFTARTVGGGAGVCNSGISWGGTTTSYVNIRSQVGSNATTAGLKGLTGAATGDTALTASNVQDNTTMAGMYVYETSA